MSNTTNSITKFIMKIGGDIYVSNIIVKWFDSLLNQGLPLNYSVVYAKNCLEKIDSLIKQYKTIEV